ncbi:MAG TPA: NAD(P)-binding domain-containing protein [Chthoniobacteraceae bacterium]|nr:NAD(P)-binding domain-containing protein [Chthoniobacteraceae bacterium]
MKKRQLAIIGAGPIGLEAALAAPRDDYDLTVFERGEIGASIVCWGHVRMFSPFGMNSSAAGRGLLAANGIAAPPCDALLTGREFVERYLAPLAAKLDARIETGVEVVAITRAGAGKMDHIAQPQRGATPFRLLLRRGHVERFEEFDLVLDCSGTFLSPNPLGDGGIAALGETAVKERIAYGIAAASNGAYPDAGRFLVVGGGHSAATVVRDLARIPAREITWVVRRAVSLPCTRIADDPLMERDRLATEANALARRIDFRPGTAVHEVRSDGNGFVVVLKQSGKPREPTAIHVDHIIAATGFRPDPALTRELQVQTCWATEGTYKLAAALLGSTGGDCLAVPAFGAETLLHPEPGYFALGMKSYGRAPDFLIKTGLEQIRALFEWLRTSR